MHPNIPSLEKIKQLLDKDLINIKHSAPQTLEHRDNLRNIDWNKWLFQNDSSNCFDLYIDKIHHWIHSTQTNQVYGLDSFKYRDVITGVTQSLDESYYEYARRNLRIFRGEYKYHRRTGYNHRINFLDDKDRNYLGLNTNDFCIISFPFCGNGYKHSHWETLLEDALEKEVPVVVDAAWFGICKDLNFDFRHPAISSVSFSLSKAMGLGQMRSGIRYSRNKRRLLPIAQQNRFNYLPLLAVIAGLQQMNSFSPDYIFSTYEKSYHKACHALGLIPSASLNIAMAPDHGHWQNFLVDEIYMRVGIWPLVSRLHQDPENLP